MKSGIENIGATYITPTEDFLRELEKKHEYDPKGNFKSSSVPITSTRALGMHLINNIDYVPQLTRDLNILAGKMTGEPIYLIRK